MKLAVLLLPLMACGVNQTPQPDEPSSLESCVPNRDGVITSDELPVVIVGSSTLFDSHASAP